MQIDLASVERLRFSDGAPVRAASGLAPFGDGFLVVQDDTTHAAWFRGGAVTSVRIFPPVVGLESFEETAGTKHLKPDLESACEVAVDGRPAVLMLGSGSSPARMRSALLLNDEPGCVVADLTPLYAHVANALQVELDLLNLEGALVIGDTFRWFHRGLPSAGLPASSIDLDVSAVVAAALGRSDPAEVEVSNAHSYQLGDIDGIGLAVTDAVVLPDGAILLSAAAEDSPNPRDDGPVVGSALVRLEGHTAVDVTPLPLVDGRVSKVEGLLVTDGDRSAVRVLAVVDVDDPREPSLALRLNVRS